MSDVIQARPALTHLSEDELSFKSAIKEFAKEEMQPLVQKMDQNSSMDPDLISKLFDMGIMGIETPEEFWRFRKFIYYGLFSCRRTCLCRWVSECAC